MENNTKIKTSYIRLFNSTNGKEVLDHLEKITLKRCLGPDSKPSEIWYLEGQRALVKTIMNMASNKAN